MQGRFVCKVCGVGDAYKKVCYGCSVEILKAGSGIVVSYCSHCGFSFDHKESFGTDIQTKFSPSSSIIDVLAFKNGCLKARCPFSRTVNLKKVAHHSFDVIELATSLQEVRAFIGL